MSLTDDAVPMDDHMRKLMALLDKQEDLHPDLVPHLQDGRIGPMIHHPLIINLFHTPMENARINHAYVTKRAEVEKAAAEGKWSQYVFWHERPYRLDALLEAIKKGISNDPQTYWELVASVWTDSENIRENYWKWRKLWQAKIPDREAAMDEGERAKLASLPETFEVWRGTGHHTATGMSWTINEEKARWFAKRFAGFEGRVPHLLSGTVSKPDALAYFAGRGEDEIVVLPEKVRNKHTAAL